MKNIGILTCLRAGRVCAGVSCLRAFAERRYFFEKYGADVRLLAFMKCNGCPKDGAAEERKECERLMEICQMIEEKGIPVIRGTHRE